MTMSLQNQEAFLCYHKVGALIYSLDPCSWSLGGAAPSKSGVWTGA